MPPLGAVVDGQRRLVILPADEAVELGVLLRLDRRPRLPPERAAVGERLLRLPVGEREDDRHRHVGRILRDHPLDRRLLGVVLGVLGEGEGDAGAARRRRFDRDRLDGEGALAVRLPAPGLVAAGAARDDLDGRRHDEGRIEADAELADQRRSFRASARHAFQEGLGAGARDRAEVLDQLRPAHADAIVGNDELARPGGEPDLEVGVAGKQLRLLQGQHAQPFAGIGGVGDQLAEKDVAVRIDRMHHQVQELRDFGLEAAGFLGLTVAHEGGP